MMCPDKIDIVYKWVDGSDKKWAEQKEYWFKKVFGAGKTYAGAGGAERFRDNGELRYSLRSVAENLPWINHIYIITGFNQIPKWLNTNNPKVTIVPHEQIFPPEALPVFCSTAIDMCIANIPNLSEHFLLCDDDMFFNKKLKPSFFYDKRGRAIVLYNKHRKYRHNIEKWRNCVDEYTRTLINAAVLVKKICGKTNYIYRPSHGVDSYIKSSMIECRNNPKIRQYVTDTINSRFRSDKCVSRWVFNLYDYITGRAVFRHCHPYKSAHMFDFIYNTIHLWSSRHSPLFCEDALASRRSIKRSMIFCINDSYKSGEAVLKHNADFLAKRFPNKCEFEK